MKIPFLSLTRALAVVAPLFTGPATFADFVGVTVLGSSDPWLAGMPDGSSASSGDIAPNQSPVLVPGLLDSAGSPMTFSATGSVSFGPGNPLQPPDGNAAQLTSHGDGSQNGISDVTAPADALMGVFLGLDQPNLTSAPSGLNFSTAASRDYLTLSPLLKQVFFIGDGLTSGNTAQQVIIPVGATRLYLGPMDGGGWYDNLGSFSVRVTGVSVVPEPASIVSLGLGVLALIGASCSRCLRKTA